jgi:transcriptional regulator GlxA family with amidase domain
MPLDVSIVAFPETSASTLYGMHDVLSSVGPEWRLLHGEEPGPHLIRSRMVGLSQDAFTCLNGALIQPHAALDEVEGTDVVCIPELVLPLTASPRGIHPELVAWLRSMFERGAVLASVCSGALLLAETGLLDGAEATTHWGFAAYLKHHYPKVSVREERVLCVVGPEARIITAGGAASWNDLVLYLIARFCGTQNALETAKLHLLQWHGEGQLPYACMAARLQHDDSIIQACQHWFAEHYDEPNPVSAATRLSGLKERTFKRRFQAATGYAPIDYVHNLRIEEAKQQLEAGDLPIDTISATVGYDDPTFFRRLFKRKTGITPHQYRRRFQPLVKSAAFAPQAKVLNHGLRAMA